jgi:hypothetical protein
LNWGLVQNANTVYLQLPDRTEGVATPGSRNVKPGSTTTYTLVAYCGNNQASISTTVYVQSGCNGTPQMNGFGANPGTIQKGQSTTLSWGPVFNATSVILQSPDGSSGVATPGSRTVAPKQTTTYTLIAYCGNRSAQLQVTVKVINPQQPTPTPPPVSNNEVRSIRLARESKGNWILTVQYFWNGEASPAHLEGIGIGQANAPATNIGTANIIPGFVKFATINVQNNGTGPPVKFTACIIGNGNVELACRTVRGPGQ